MLEAVTDVYVLLRWSPIGLVMKLRTTHSAINHFKGWQPGSTPTYYDPFPPYEYDSHVLVANRICWRSQVTSMAHALISQSIKHRYLWLWIMGGESWTQFTISYYTTWRPEPRHFVAYFMYVVVWYRYSRYELDINYAPNVRFPQLCIHPVCLPSS